MAYSEKVIDHYQNPKNVGTLDKSSKSVGTGLVGAPECGDVMRLQIQVDESTGMITDAKFKTFCWTFQCESNGCLITHKEKFTCYLWSVPIACF